MKSVGIRGHVTHTFDSSHVTKYSIRPDISRAIFSRAEGECKYMSEMCPAILHNDKCNKLFILTQLKTTVFGE